MRFITNIQWKNTMANGDFGRPINGYKDMERAIDNDETWIIHGWWRYSIWYLWSAPRRGSNEEITSLIETYYWIYKEVQPDPNAIKSKNSFVSWIPYLRMYAFEKDGEITGIRPKLLRGKEQLLLLRIVSEYMASPLEKFCQKMASLLARKKTSSSSLGENTSLGSTLDSKAYRKRMGSSKKLLYWLYWYGA